MDLTARGAYGFSGWSPTHPGGTAMIAETQIGSSGDIPAMVSGSLPLNWHNPLFWLLALFLLFTGWIYAGAELGVRRIGDVKVRAGR